ncbi:hypothetical protein TNCV_2668181 [Trichonephila clavipes]|nr:hypothetical protein TNCV_2668181 [Trichonephila clavipes]
MMDRISICEDLAKRNEIDPFFKRMVTWDEKRVTYDNIVRKRSWSKRSESASLMSTTGPFEASDRPEIARELLEEVLCSIRTTPGHTLM